MPTIQTIIQSIRTAVYGREVRSSIADGIENISARQDLVDNNETERQISEVSRQTNESNRVTAETTRTNAETTRETDWDRMKAEFDTITVNVDLKTFKYEEGYYTSLVDGTTSFNLNATAFNPFTDSVELWYSDGARMFKNKEYTISGSLITLVGWSLNKDDFISWIARKGTSALDPPGTNGADLMEASVAKSKLELSVQTDLNKIGEIILQLGNVLPLGDLTQFSVYKSNKDVNGLYTTVSIKRKDGTLAITSVLSGGTSPNYTTKVETYYKSDGTIIGNPITYTRTYDATDNSLVNEVIN